MIRFSLISILTERCNLSCEHCSSSSTPKKNAQVDIEDVTKAMSDFSQDFKDKQHLVSGGEPTLYKGLRELLTFSKDHGYKTGVVTNAHWVNPNNISQSEELLEKLIPENISLFASFDFYHLRKDPSLRDRIYLLYEITKGRNHVSLDGAYNGTKELRNLFDAIDEEWELNPIQVQKIGRGALMENMGQLDKKYLYCPMGNNKGFTISPDGIYHCFRGALNHNPRTKISDKYLKGAIEQFSQNFSAFSLNQEIKSHGIDSDLTHVCDICEKL